MTQTYTDIDLSFDELVRACGGGADWVVQLIEEEVISINGSPAQARYSSQCENLFHNKSLLKKT